MMEKVISNEMTKLMMILGAMTLVLSFVMVRVATALKNLFLPYRKQTIIYGIIGLVTFGLGSIFAYPFLLDSPVVSFYSLQLFFSLVGILHVFAMRRNLGWSVDRKENYLDIIFTLLLSLAGTIVFLLVCQWINKTGIFLAQATAVLFFIIPLLFYRTYLAAIAIPPKIMQAWFYPVGEEIDEPEDAQLRNLLVISFEFRKQVGDPNITSFRAKAPAEMDFGRLFYYFINDYNERHPESKIHLADSDGKAYGWIFYKKPGWRTFLTSYIDSEKKVMTNRIRENDIIICSRSVQ